ncbi:MAG: hypothetical protein C0622_15005 [Desulfuromonas sp.]|nr:MAG: hypothetical protein C0622_15005 [Desulfuromonas sp.]
MIFGLGLGEIALLVAVVVILFGVRGVSKGSRDLGRAYGLSRKLKQRLPWLGKIPLLSRFFR